MTNNMYMVFKNDSRCVFLGTDKIGKNAAACGKFIKKINDKIEEIIHFENGLIVITDIGQCYYIGTFDIIKKLHYAHFFTIMKMQNYFYKITFKFKIKKIIMNINYAYLLTDSNDLFYITENDVIKISIPYEKITHIHESIACLFVITNLGKVYSVNNLMDVHIIQFPEKNNWYIWYYISLFLWP